MTDSINSGKCEVVHFGGKIQGQTYTVNGLALGSVVEQNDLGYIRYVVP